MILGQNPSFHLHAGDICYADPDGKGSDHDTYDARVWDQFLAQTESVAKSVPWMVTTGNHDMEAWYSPNGYGGQSARWSLPGNGPDAENAPGIYSFTYGNVAVVALDANDVSYEIPANQGYTGGKQTRRLDRRLAELRYERTDAIKAGRVAKKMPIGEAVDAAREGIVYVTAGGAGKSLYGFPVPDSYEGHVKDLDHVDTYHWSKGQVKAKDTVEWSRVRYTGYSFLAVEVTPGHRPRMTVTALAESGERIDHFEVTRSH